MDDSLYVMQQDAHANSAWQPSNDSACDPGWMLPLVLMSRTYSTFLSTFGDDYMYRLQRPLPLQELYNGPQHKGLLSLLKFAIWQARPFAHLHHADTVHIYIENHFLSKAFDNGSLLLCCGVQYQCC